MNLLCPKCANPMRQYERNEVIVDQCTECGGLFLDRGELERLAQAEANYYDPQAAQPLPARADRRPAAGPEQARAPRAYQHDSDRGFDPRYGRKHDSDRGYDPRYGRKHDSDRGFDPRYGRKHDSDRGYDPRYGKPRRKKGFFGEMMEMFD